MINAQGVKKMSGGDEVGFTFEEVKRREWRTKTWIEATKHTFYGINVNYEAKMVYAGEGLNLDAKNMDQEGARVDNVLLVSVGKGHFYVEFSTRKPKLVAKAMALVETAVEDRDRAINRVMDIVRVANETRIEIDMNEEAMRPE
jgi:hypothetical protein